MPKKKYTQGFKDQAVQKALARDGKSVIISFANKREV